MKHPLDQIDHTLILALRAGRDAEMSATLAHYMKGNERRYHIEDALKSADEVTAAAVALRAEIARLNTEDAAAPGVEVEG